MPRSSSLKATDSTFQTHNTSDKMYTERSNLKAVQLEQINSCDKPMAVDRRRFAYTTHLLPLLFPGALSQHQVFL